MKKQLFLAMLCCCLLFCSRLSAQHVYFSDTSNVWGIVSVSAPNNYMVYSLYRYKASNSYVQLNGKQYTLIQGEDGTDIELVRDDTLNRKVYVKPINWYGYTVSDTNEFVYLDYNMNVGDTLTMPFGYPSPGFDSVCHYVLMSSDSIFNAGEWYRTMSFAVYLGSAYNSSQYQCEVFEGIGPGSGPVVAISDGSHEWGPGDLSCFENHENSFPDYFQSSCDNVLAITNADVSSAFNFKAYPNPSYDKINIQANKPAQKQYEIRLVDLTGRICLHASFKSRTVLNTQNMEHGLYIIQFFDGDILLQSQKFLLE